MPKRIRNPYRKIQLALHKYLYTNIIKNTKITRVVHNAGVCACVWVYVSVTYLCKFASVCVCVCLTLLNSANVFCFTTFCISFAHFSFVIFFICCYSKCFGIFFVRLSFKIFNLYSTEFLWKTAEETLPGFKLRTESFLGKMKHKSLQDVRNICIWGWKGRERWMERKKQRVKKRVCEIYGKTTCVYERKKYRKAKNKYKFKLGII